MVEFKEKEWRTILEIVKEESIADKINKVIQSSKRLVENFNEFRGEVEDMRIKYKKKHGITDIYTEKQQ